MFKHILNSINIFDARTLESRRKVETDEALGNCDLPELDGQVTRNRKSEKNHEPNRIVPIMLQSPCCYFCETLQ